jgi:hypothetical protein
MLNLELVCDTLNRIFGVVFLDDFLSFTILRRTQGSRSYSREFELF